MNSNVLWFLVSWYDLNFVCVLVNHSRTHKYQELSKSINPLITIDAFNDFLIQSQNHYKICSCHICSCMFLVWTLIYGFALMKLLSNLLNNLLNFFWVHAYELQNVSSGLLPFRCSSTLWTLWRLFIYFLQKLLEAYKWEIICFDKQDDSFFEVQRNISLHLVHHCM